MISKSSIIAGALGGIGPNLVRLIVNYSSPNPQPMISQPLSYCAALLGFAVLGGLIAWGFHEKNFKRALFLGIGIPAMFQVGTLQSLPSATPLPPSSAPPLAGWERAVSLVGTAYAQQPTAPSAPVLGRKLGLTGDPKTPPYTIAFYGADNKLQSTQPVANPGSQTVDVPPAATKFALQVGESTSPSYELSKTPSTFIKAEIKITEKTGSGFLQGVGLAKGKQYEIQIRLH
jgi:hypothetical protein